MLVLNNGAPKSGSVWLHSILCWLLLPYEPPDRRWWPEGWSGASVSPEKLSAFLATEDWRSRTMLFKAHYDKSEQVSLLSQPNIFVINLTRYLPDAIVSLYHHYRHIGATQDDLATWVETRGLQAARGIVNYHALWRRTAFVTSFEQLKREGVDVALSIARFVEIDCSRIEAECILDQCSFEAMRPALGAHARKGEIGTSRDELTSDHFRELDSLDTFTDRALL